MSEGSGDLGFECLTEFIALLHILHVSVIKGGAHENMINNIN